MPIDATVRHAFAYSGSALLMADEHTMVTAAGNTLQFSSTVTHSQHFLVRNKARKILAFDVNWRTSEIALTSRDPNPEILLYSYPDKKLRGKLANAASMEYSLLKYSRCGRRLLSIYPDDNSASPADEGKGLAKRLCLWDVEKLELLKGCGASPVAVDVAFASFDPSNSDHFLLGGSDGLVLYKIYKGKASFMLRHVAVTITQWVSRGQSRTAASLTASASRAAVSPVALSPANQQDIDEKRSQFVCHAWMRQGQLLVANQAGELAVIDTSATVASSELTAVLLDGATRPNRCVIVGVVYTSEAIVCVYADGTVAWLGERDGDVLQTTSLPCCLASEPSSSDGSSIITAVSVSPNFSKVYVGTVTGQLYELKVSVALEDEDEAEDDGLAVRGQDDPSIVASRLISSCGSFHHGAVFTATLLTPAGGTLSHDLLVATGGASGRIHLWSVAKCRGMGETNLVGLFAVGASALVHTTATGTDDSSATAAVVAPTDTAAANTTNPDLSPPVVITALAARPADPVLLAGDHAGKLRALCVAKVVGGNGALEFLPLHSVQLFDATTVVDLLELHPSQPFALAASTHDRHVFVLSLDHERHFAVLAYASLEGGETVVDVKWSVPPHSPAALSFTMLSSTNRLYLARHQDSGATSSSSSSSGSSSKAAAAAAATTALRVLPSTLKTKVLAHGDDTAAAALAVRFLSDAPVNTMLGVSPRSPDLLLLKYADLVIDPNERVPLQAKTLAQDDAPGLAALAVLGQRLRNGEQLVATASVHGAVTLWLLSFSGSSALQTGELHLEDVQAAKKKTLVAHLGAVTSLAFASVGEDVFLLSTGADGCVFVLDVRITSDLHGLARPEPIMAPLYLSVAAFAKYEDPFKPESDVATRPLLSVVADEREAAARARFDRLKDKTRATLNDLEMKLKILLAENDKLPPHEQLARDEFVLHTEWRDRVVRQNQARAAAVREGIRRDLAKMAIVRERMKQEFWDAASVPGVKLRGLLPPSSSSSSSSAAPPVSPLFVLNFPMRKPARHETLRSQRMLLLRLVEYEHLKHEIEAANAPPPPSATGRRPLPSSAPPPAAPSALARFQDTVVPSLQWLIGAGAHHPALNRWLADKLPTKDKEGVVTPSSSSSSLLMPVSPPPSLHLVQSFHLVYHPAAVRTGKQQRLQVSLLKWYVRFLVAEFNRDFDALATLKAARMDEIDAKHARMREIAGELGLQLSAAELQRPTWAPDERAASILEVRGEEMTQPPYESEQERRRREAEAAERAALERQRQKDDVAGRALRDMMNGTLEVKKETLVGATLAKEPWMLETPVDEMTAEQKKLLAQFEAAQQKLKDDQEKLKKSLDLELKKIKGEVAEIARAFDDKLRALQDVAMGMKSSVLVQQLYELSLADDLMEREHLAAACTAQQRALATLAGDIRAGEKESELFAAQVEACKDEWLRAVEEDKAHDRGFVRELEEAAGVALEHELVKHVVELFKKRKGDDVRVGGGGAATAAGGGGGGGANGPKRGKSSMHLGGSKHRLLAEAAGEPSSRTLAAASLLQNLQASASNGALGEGGGLGGGGGGGGEGEYNFDPFAGVELPLFQAATGKAAAVQRHVVPLDYETDRPDGVALDDRVWRALNELRTRKVLAEHAVREKADALAHAKGVADELRSRLQELREAHAQHSTRLEATRARLAALRENAPLLVHLKQGQDETSADAGGDGDGSLLVARASVERLNDVLQLHGKDQVGVLGKIKHFRKNINVMEWEHARLALETRDAEERYTDLQLLRVTKDLQALFHTGDTSARQQRELALLEAKGEHVGRHHQAAAAKLAAQHALLARQLRERVRENEAFALQVAALETQVQIREEIVASRTSAALRAASSSSVASASSQEDKRLQAIAVRRKLVDLARAQTEEIEFLRGELDKMRRRTFPTFASAAQRDGHY